MQIMKQHIKPLQILKASAGSGKTFSLTVRFLSLLFSSDHLYKRTLAVTFTNKATAEMKSRILEVLKDFALGNWHPVRAYLQEIQLLFPNLSQEDIQKKSDRIYRLILHDYGHLTITTIDKFVQQIIRNFTFELGIYQDYKVTLNTRQVISDLSEKLHYSLEQKPQILQWILDEARKNIQNGKSWNYQKTLNKLSNKIFSDEFQAFSQSFEQADQDLIFESVKKKSNQATIQFEQQIEVYLQTYRQQFSLLQIDTDILHKKSKSPLFLPLKDKDGFLKYISRSGTKQLDTILNQPDNWYSKSASPSKRTAYPILNPILQQIIGLIQMQYPDYLLAKEINDNLYYLRLMKEMSNLLKEYRVENHLLLISDATHLLEGITQGMEDNPSFIWEKTGNRYQHFLFDEFQDTSRNQWRNFLPLVKNALANSKGMYIEQLIVGDVKQSIYRWRGGDWNILLNQVQQDLGTQFVSTDSLQINFRSDERIIAFNNELFPVLTQKIQEFLNQTILAQSGEVLYQNYWCRHQFDQIILKAYADVVQQKPKDKPEQEGIVEWELIQPDGNLKQDMAAATLEVMSERLYRWIVEEKRYRPGQIGILVRKNEEAATIINYLEKDLINRKHPEAYEVTSDDALKISKHPVIQLLISTLRALVERGNSRTYHFKICTYLYQVIQAQPKQDNPSSDAFIEMMNLESPLFKGLSPFTIFSQTNRLKTLSMSNLLEELIATYQLSENLHALSYLLSMRDIITQYESTGQNSLHGFLEWWDNQEEFSLNNQEESTAIRVSTIHKSKGLAYDVVLIPFASWELNGKASGQFWVNMSQTAYHELPVQPIKYVKALANTPIREAYFEEMLYSYMDGLNALYVALTRAKKHLYLSFPDEASSNHSYRNIHHFILNFLSEMEQAHPNFANQYAKNITSQSIQNHTQPANTWSFSRYPISRHLKKQLEVNIPENWNWFHQEEKIRTGIAAHHVLANCQRVEDLPNTIRRLIQEGFLLQKEETTIEKLAKRVLEHPALQTLLKTPGRFLQEREIIDENGQSHRPDVVIISPQETIILDYKFGVEKSEHIDQVRHYIQLFDQMHYSHINAYLFYGFQGKLQKVTK